MIRMNTPLLNAIAGEIWMIMVPIDPLPYHLLRFDSACEHEILRNETYETV